MPRDVPLQCSAPAAHPAGGETPTVDLQMRCRATPRAQARGVLFGGASVTEPVDHEIEVTMLLTTSRDDIRAALDRSRIMPGALIGEALILSTEVYAPEGD